MRERVTAPFIDYFRDPAVVLTRDGRVQALNSAFEKVFDLKREDLSGKDCREAGCLADLWNSITACALNRAEQVERLTHKGAVFDAYIVPVINDGFLNNVFIELRDVSDYVNLEKEFLKRNKELVITNALSGTFISSHNIDSVFDELLEKILIISDMSICWIVLKDDAGFALKGSSGISGEFRAVLEGGGVDYLYKRVCGSAEPMQVLDTEEVSAVKELRDEGIVFLAALPLKSGSDVTGALVLASRVGLKFDFDTASLFSMLGNNVSLIADKIKLFQETQRLAVTDDLTGLHNARYFYDVLGSEVARTKRYSTPFSIVLFDVDNFKQLNDTYGHQAGDDVLRSIASVMKKTSRAPDTIARYGGEEFIAVLPNASVEEAFHLATRIKDAVESTTFLGDESVKVTVSGGVASFPKDAKDAKSLLYAADMAMYSAKAAGKGRVVCFGNQ